MVTHPHMGLGMGVCVCACLGVGVGGAESTIFAGGQNAGPISFKRVRVQTHRVRAGRLPFKVKGWY